MRTRLIWIWMPLATIPVLLLWCTTIAAQQGNEAEPSREVRRPEPFKPFPIVLETPKDDPDAQACARIEIVVPADGHLFIWATSTESPPHDLTIEVLDDAGKSIATDDDSGGRPIPFVELDDVEKRRRRTVVVRSKDGWGKGEFRHTLAPETERTRALAADIGVRIRAISELRQKNELNQARGQMTALVAYLLDEVKIGDPELPPARSHALYEAQWVAGYEARSLALLEEASHLWRGACRFLERMLPSDQRALQGARLNLGATLFDLGDFVAARILLEQVLAGYERTLPKDHPDLLRARLNLGGTLHGLGDLVAAKALFEQALAGYERTLPKDHPDLRRARNNLGATLVSLGDLQGATKCFEMVVAVSERTLPADHGELQAARLNLGVTLDERRDYVAARKLFEQVLGVYERTLPEDHPDLLQVQVNLGSTLSSIGDLESARKLFEQAVAGYERTMPDHHPYLQQARANLSEALRDLGDPVAARPLIVQALSAYESTLPADNPAVLRARVSLGATLHELGHTVAARKLFEQVLVVYERTLPEDHPSLLRVRANLCSTLAVLGDWVAARALLEQVLAVYEHTLPANHIELQWVRQNLAVTLSHVGEMDAARKLLEQVIESYEGTLPDDHPEVQSARLNLGLILKDLGDLQGARRLVDQLLAVRESALPADHPEVQRARGNLGGILRELGELEAARRLFEQVLAALEVTLPAEHPGMLIAHLNLCGTYAALGEMESARRCAEAYLRGAKRHLESFRTLSLTYDDSTTLARAVSIGRRHLRDDPFATGLWVALIEEKRATAKDRASLLERLGRFEAEADDAGRALVLAWRRACHTLISSSRTISQPMAITEAIGERDQAWAALREALAVGGEALRQRIDIEAIRASLEPSDLAVGFWRYTNWMPKKGAPHLLDSEIRDLVYIVGPSEPLTVVDLGSAETTDSLTERWLAFAARRLTRSPPAKESRTVAARKLGGALRAHLVDPILAAAEATGDLRKGDAPPTIRRLFVTQSAAVATVPLEALPMIDGRQLGESIRVEVITSWIELQDNSEANGIDEAPRPSLLALGGIDYDGEPLPFEELLEEREDSDDALAAGDGALPDTVIAGVSEDRGLWESVFAALPQSEAEVEAITDTFRKTFGKRARRDLLLEDEGSKQAFIRLAPSARTIHLATHGYFAPETIPSTYDPRPEHLAQMVMFQSTREIVVGLAPSLLCGLAFAGANLGPDKVDGILTAEELMHLDLRKCDLAVLSACETNVGIERAGLMMGTLRDALHAAGVRRAITSLWRVDDEATRILMTEFYRLHWAEKMPVSEALWAAKMHVRGLKNEDGTPRFGLKHWAGFVVSGVPRRR